MYPYFGVCVESQCSILPGIHDTKCNHSNDTKHDCIGSLSWSDSSGHEDPKIGSECLFITVNQRLANLVKAHMLHKIYTLLAQQSTYF